MNDVVAQRSALLVALDVFAQTYFPGSHKHQEGRLTNAANGDVLCDAFCYKKYPRVKLGLADPEDFDALVLPGGLANLDSQRAMPEEVAFVRDFGISGKPLIAAICHGLWLLIEAGLVDGRYLTSWPAIQIYAALICAVLLSQRADVMPLGFLELENTGRNLPCLGASNATIADRGVSEVLPDDTFFFCPAGKLNLLEVLTEGESICCRWWDQLGPKEWV